MYILLLYIIFPSISFSKKNLFHWIIKLIQYAHKRSLDTRQYCSVSGTQLYRSVPLRSTLLHRTFIYKANERKGKAACKGTRDPSYCIHCFFDVSNCTFIIVMIISITYYNCHVDVLFRLIVFTLFLLDCGLFSIIMCI